MKSQKQTKSVKLAPLSDWRDVGRFWRFRKFIIEKMLCLSAVKGNGRVQVIIHRFIGCSTCRNLKLVLEGATYAVNDEVPLEMSNLSADNAPIFPCDYGECPFVNWAWPYHCEEAAIHYYGMTIEYILRDVALVRLIWMWVREAVNFSIEHSITIVKESSSITIQWYDNGKREWLQLPLLVGNHYYGN